jgi:hypothetical protein
MTNVMMLIVRQSRPMMLMSASTESLFWSDLSTKFSLSHHSGAKRSEHA